MATYSTLTTLQTLMVGTQFDSKSTSLATQCLDDAEAEVNKYLSKRYDLTTFNTSTSIPPLVRTLTNRLAQGYMWIHQSRGRKETITYGEKYIKMALENLQMIADYKLDLLDTSGSAVVDTANSSYQILSNTDDYVNTFNEDDPLNWDVDSNKLEDISSERDGV